MKRCIAAIGLCWGLASTGAIRGEEVEWRAVGSKPTTNAASVTQTQHATPTTATSNEPPAANPNAPATPLSNVITATPDTTLPAPPTTAPVVGPMPEECTTCCPTVYSDGYVVGPTRFFVRAEFLAWWTRSAGGPPLLTTTTVPFPALGPNGELFPDANGNVPISSLNNIGALGAPGTVVLLGGNQFDEYRPGARFSFGYWFDECGIRGIDGSIFFTGRRTQDYTADNTQFSTLFRPFFAADPRIDLGNMPGQFREIIAATSLGINGQFAARGTSEFWGADLNYRRCLWRSCTGMADVFAGFRYLNLDEDLNIYEDIRATRDINFTDATGATVANLLAGSRFTVRDQFSTSNDFYGAQLGVDAEFQRDRWYVGVRPSVALGVTHQQVIINGSSTTVIPGQGTQTLVGGLYALNSNIGSDTSNPFTVVPELQVKLGYQLTSRLRVSIGCDFLYWSSVVRPGDQIDFTLDTNRLPPPQTPVVNPPRPAPLFNQTDFWAMGFNTGLEYRW